MLNKSPSGSLCPYYYKGGELQPLHYGSYHNDFERLFKVMDEEQDFILKSHGGRRIWIDLYETQRNAAFYKKLCSHIIAISAKISKLALVGCSWKDKRIISKSLGQHGYSFDLAYYDDPEIAKDWLVGQLQR